MIKVAKDWYKGGYNFSQQGGEQIGGCYWKYQTKNSTTYQKPSTGIATHQD
jgi:hypothetical protein